MLLPQNARFTKFWSLSGWTTEFISNCGTLMLNWLREFFSQCMCGLRLPKVWRRADIIAVLKPNKSAHDAKNYRPISLLKLLERLLLSRFDPVLDPQLPPEQAGFRHGRSTTDQVTLLTDDIEAGFEHTQKAGVALVDLTAAYDTVWLRGLHLKFEGLANDYISQRTRTTANSPIHHETGPASELAQGPADTFRTGTFFCSVDIR